jgi:hypothetical protein
MCVDLVKSAIVQTTKNIDSPNINQGEKTILFGYGDDDRTFFIQSIQLRDLPPTVGTQKPIFLFTLCFLSLFYTLFYTCILTNVA